MASTDPWHFPRRDHAERTLSLLSGKLARALTLFGPRRTGKTEFLLKDLGPLAEERKHRVIYASFWQAPLAPLAVLLHALETATRRGSFTERAKSLALAMTPKIKLSGKLPGASVEAEIDLTRLEGKPPADLLIYLDDLLTRLAKPSRPTILMLDEVQELARHGDNAPLVAALRTSLDKNREGIATIFTGSSREGLQAMFAARDAPFFHFATPIELPPLDKAFVDHQLAAFANATKRKLKPAPMLAAFEELHRSPYLFRGLLELLLADPALELTEALRRLKERVALDLRFPEIWLKLTSIQRVVALQLARDVERPFAQVTREEMARHIGETEALTIARVQSALRRLQSLDIAARWEERWTIADAEFKSWILARPATSIA